MKLFTTITASNIPRPFRAHCASISATFELAIKLTTCFTAAAMVGRFKNEDLNVGLIARSIALNVSHAKSVVTAAA